MHDLEQCDQNVRCRDVVYAFRASGHVGEDSQSHLLDLGEVLQSQETEEELEVADALYLHSCKNLMFIVRRCVQVDLKKMDIFRVKDRDGRKMK